MNRGNSALFCSYQEPYQINVQYAKLVKTRLGLDVTEDHSTDACYKTTL